ncbi:MAG TPA: hypothetical protein VHW25_02280 [Steroidobacteraceae bacterium]|nr:hypothetical protein [Steroidobacteraceae bacterium]
MLLAAAEGMTVIVIPLDSTGCALIFAVLRRPAQSHQVSVDKPAATTAVMALEV